MQKGTWKKLKAKTLGKLYALAKQGDTVCIDLKRGSSSLGAKYMANLTVTTKNLENAVGDGLEGIESEDNDGGEDIGQIYG